MTEQPRTKDEAHPSRAAMIAAVEIELLVAMGGYATVAYGKKIQAAIDASTPDASLLRELVGALERCQAHFVISRTILLSMCEGNRADLGEEELAELTECESFLTQIDAALSRARKVL